MAMLHVTTGWTADMLDALPDDGRRYEIIGGELIVNPSPSWRHQGIAGLLRTRLATYLEATGAGWLVPEVDVKFNADNLVRPDLIVAPMVNGRPPRSLEEAGRLLLVIEVLSRSSKNLDRHAKRLLYLRMGVPEYWIVDQRGRCVEISRAGAASAEIVVDVLELRPDPGLPPLKIALAELFDRVGS